MHKLEIYKTFRYRLYPTEEQEQFFRKGVGCRRYLWNLLVDLFYTNLRRTNPRWLIWQSICKELPELKAEAEFLQEVPAHALTQTVIDFFKAVDSAKKGSGGYPTHKKRGIGESYAEFDPASFSTSMTCIKLPKIGRVEWVYHRSLEGETKFVTVINDAGQWYACVVCKVEVDDPIHSHRGNPVGLDLGVSKPITTSLGEHIMLPKVSEKEMKKLANLQRKLARKTLSHANGCRKGNKNKAKARLRIAKHHAYLRRRRLDASHKATTKIVKNHDVIVIENLKVRNMTASASGTIENPGRNVRQKSGLNRAILDVAPYQIRRLLEYKCLWYGSELRVVPAHFTSQRCSKCGYIHADNRLSQSEFVCKKCGHAENADVNAAKNIEYLGVNPGISITAGQAGVDCESNCTKQSEPVIEATQVAEA